MVSFSCLFSCFYWLPVFKPEYKEKDKDPHSFKPLLPTRTFVSSADMAHLPEELVNEILRCCPPWVLARTKCVSSAWNKRRLGHCQARDQDFAHIERYYDVATLSGLHASRHNAYAFPLLAMKALRHLAIGLVQDHELRALAELGLQSFSCDCLELSAQAYDTFADMRRLEQLALRNLRWTKALTCPPNLTKLCMHRSLALVRLIESGQAELVSLDFQDCDHLDLEQLRPLLSSRLRSLSIADCKELYWDEFPPHAHLESLTANPCLTREQSLAWLLGLTGLLHLRLFGCGLIDGNSLARLHTLHSLEVTVESGTHQTMSMWGICRDLPDLAHFVATEQLHCAQALRLGKKDNLGCLPFVRCHSVTTRQSPSLTRSLPWKNCDWSDATLVDSTHYKTSATFTCAYWFSSVADWKTKS